MNQSHDVLVVGAGVVGLTAALAMATRGFQVALIDAGDFQVDLTHSDVRVYAINQASQQLLESLDVWPLLAKERLSPYRHMHVWDASNQAHIDFDSRYVASPYIGTIIEESVLKHALLQKIATQDHIELFSAQMINEVNEEELGIRISSQGHAWAGQLLMVADGANSPIRQKLKVELSSWPYHQHALVATVKTEKMHQQTAYQVFNADGPLAFLPLNDPHQCSIVWSTSMERVQQLMDMDEPTFNNALGKAFAERLGSVEVVSPRHQFPLRMRHVKQYTGNHWLLLGDAAHTIHPLAGLGLNVGLADVATWIQCMQANPQSFFSKKQLGRYQRERKNAVWQTILLMQGFKELFSYTAAPVSGLRGIGLRFCNDLPSLKRWFMQQAGG